MTDKKTEYCYSWDDEIFNSEQFSSVEDALADATETALDDGCGRTEVYIGEVEPWHNSDFFPSAGWVLEHMQEQAWSEGGDYADDYAEVPSEASDELTEQLTTLLNAWCEKHGVSPKFYRVRNSKLYQLPSAAA